LTVIGAFEVYNDEVAPTKPAVDLVAFSSDGKGKRLNWERVFEK